MKIKITENEKIKNKVREGLKANDFYCPCVVDSRGKEEYRCMCEDFRNNVKKGEYCYCGLYYKVED
jgi:ferredoxin-thioredoxin reductase catalytic subunit